MSNPKRLAVFPDANPGRVRGTAGAREPSRDGQQETTVLGEVIVTAQKRAENLQDVPISVATHRQRDS